MTFPFVWPMLLDVDSANGIVHVHSVTCKYNYMEFLSSRRQHRIWCGSTCSSPVVHGVPRLEKFHCVHVRHYFV